MTEDYVGVYNLLKDLLLIIRPTLSLVLGADGVGTFTSEVCRVEVRALLRLLLFEEIQGKLRAKLPNLIDEVFEGLHPELINRGNEFYPRSFEPLGVG